MYLSGGPNNERQLPKIFVCDSIGHHPDNWHGRGTISIRPGWCSGYLDSQLHADPGTGGCDSTECTLREAITAAAGGDNIDFDASLSDDTIAIATPLTIGKNLNIDGSSLAEMVTISGQQKVKMVIVNSSAQVTFKSLIFTDDPSSPTTYFLSRNRHFQCRGSIHP